MRRFTAAGIAFGLVVLSLVVLPASPASAAEWSGNRVPGHPGWSGVCNTTFRGVDNGADGWQVELACQASIPADARITGFNSITVPFASNWSALVGLTGYAAGPKPENCPLPNVDPENPQLGAVYTAQVNGSGDWIGLCGGSPEGQHGADVFTQIVTHYAEGQPYQYESGSWKAVQFRMLVIATDPLGSQGAPLANVISNVAGAGTSYPDPWTVLAHTSPTAPPSTAFILGVANGPLQESDQNNTPAAIPPDYFTGGSVENAPCRLTSWTGPPRDTRWQAGTEYAFRFTWEGPADSIKVQADGVVNEVQVEPVASPQTILWTAAETGNYNVFAFCHEGGQGYGWGAYTDQELIPDGGEDWQECMSTTGLGINPSSWVPGLGRMFVCILRSLFVPDMEAALSPIQTAMDDSGIGDVATAVGVVGDSWGSLSNAVQAEQTCRGTEVVLPLGGQEVEMAPFDYCSGPNATIVPWIRKLLLVGLYFGFAFTLFRIVGGAVGLRGDAATA